MRVEIWSDVICPWCYIGKRRFEQALEQFAGRDDVELEWKSFELDPSSPVDPQPLAERLAAKFGVSHDEAVAMNERMTETAAAVGLRFQLDVAQSGNTFDAHRLIKLAATHGLQDAVKERLMAGYFGEGRAISDRETLVDLASSAGLAADEARSTLESDRFAAEVRADEELARGFGISGVPFFVLDRRLGVSGAQSPEVLLDALEQAQTT